MVTRFLTPFLVLLTLFATLPAAAAEPLEPKEITSKKLDVGFFEGRAWTDFNADGRADYCRVVDNDGVYGRLRCSPSTGSAFGEEVTSFQIDAGFFEGRAWADFNGDGASDYFRVVQNNGKKGRIRVTLSDPENGSFTTEITSGEVDVEFYEGRSPADFNGDGKSDYCWVHTANQGTGKVSCLLSVGDRFDRVITSKEIDVGFYEGRTWADVNGDGKADYCRVVNTNGNNGAVRCSLSTGDAFGNEWTSKSIDAGYYEGRAWSRFFGSKRTDYCRLVGGVKARCLEAAKEGFGGEITSGAMDAGYYEGRAWPDYNGDKHSDYCRITTNNGSNGRVACTPSSGTSFGPTVTWGPLDAGYYEGRGWPDFNGDARADYCRVVGSNTNQGYVRCTLLQ